jgi:predicted transcriptional regulator
MTTNTESEQIPDYPLDVSIDAFYELVKILNALGNEDALAIFLYAADGIPSSKDAIRTLQLTQKRFYTRLKDLIDVNLINKVEGEYQHTALGKFFFNMKKRVEPVLENRERLELIDKIGQAGSLSNKEAQRIAEILSLDELTGDRVYQVKVVDTFEKAVYNVINFVENAETSIYFASKYFDIRVSQSCMSAMERGVDTYFLVGSENNITSAVKMIKPLLTNPKYLKIVVQYLKTPKINIRYADLPYTFVVVDEKRSMIEVPKPFTNEFSLAIFFDSDVFSQRLVDNFKILWENASEVIDKLHINGANNKNHMN